MKPILVWSALAAAVLVPLAGAAGSELLAWRDPIYIGAGFAGIVGLCLLLVQPLLIGGYLPLRSPQIVRRVHLWVGAGLVAAVVLHVVGLWITSPPDVVDVLLFRSPTPFSVWGAVAMWAVFIVAVLAASRRRLALGLTAWRISHAALAVVIVAGTVIHAVLIEGTMEPISKAVLSAFVVVATAVTLAKLRYVPRRQRRA
jgi:predicted ferric reductase